MDEYNYDRLAFALSGGGGDRSLLPFSLPLYPRFLALGNSLFGRDLLLVRLIQSAIGAVSVLLLYFLGRSILSEKTGRLASLLLMLYGPAVFHEGLLVPATLALFLSLAALLFWADDRGGFLRGLGGGVLLGLAGLAAAANLIFAAFLILRLVVRRGERPRRAAGAALGVGLALLPFALASHSASGDFILTSAHAGVNFYIGNNPEANGGYKTPLRLTPSATGIIRDSIRIAESETGRRLSPAETSRFWMGRGLAFIRSSPSSFVRLIFAKIRLVIGRREYRDVGGAGGGKQEAFRFWGIPFLPFFLVGPLGLAGMMMSLVGPVSAYAHRAAADKCDRAAMRPPVHRTGLQPAENIAPDVVGPVCDRATGPADIAPAGQNDGQEKNRLILYFYAAAHALGMALFYYQARARLLLVPVFCLFAAEAAFAFLGAWGERRYRRAGIILALTLGFMVFSAFQPWLEMRSETNILIMAAQAEAGEGRPAAALEKIARARELNPELGGADLVEGGIYFLAGERTKAENCFRQAARQEPLNPDPALNLGFLHLQERRLAEAQTEAEIALAVDPLSSRAQILLARIFGERSDTDGEAEAYKRSLELNPNEIEALLNLAGMSEQRGDRREAERLRRRAERVGPDIRLKAED